MNYKDYSEEKKEISYKNNNLNCSVSKASNEIMLNRISDGEDLEFPFNSSLNIK